MTDERPAITIDEARDLLLSYARCSSDRLLSIFGQEQEIADWAEGEGYEIVGLVRDRKVHSQSQVADRKGLTAVVAAIEGGKAAGVIVHQLDRLARDWETQDDAIQKIWRAGGRVFSTDYGEWKPDKRGQPQWHLRKKYAADAEAEMYALLARLKDGRDRKRKLQGYTGGNRRHRPYGRRLVGSDYVPVPHEQAVIREMCEFCQNGRGYAEMARLLNARSEPTVTKKAPWDRKVVRDLVHLGPIGLVAMPDVIPTDEPIQWIRNVRRQTA